MPDPIPANRDEAAMLFIERVVSIFNAHLSSIVKMLEEGPSGKRLPKELVELHQWYQNSSIVERQKMIQIAREAMDSAFFGILVLLDGMKIGYEVAGTFSDFALYLQTYATDEDMPENKPETSLRLNTLFEGIALHDLYLDRIADEGLSGREEKIS